MPSVFIISDTHFGHEGSCQWLREDGVTKVRPFPNAQALDETLVAQWNAVVKPGDKVYHLGDVAINRRALPILQALHGKKVLIKGNHDIFKLTDYTRFFYDIRAYHFLDNRLLLSHVPVHESQLFRFPVNVHGHLHEKRVRLADGTADPRYVNVCVEHWQYRPIELGELLTHIAAS
jgi:calcineurin-like phosphoesterase family protein